MADDGLIRPLIAGNWKMNGRRADGVALASELVRQVRRSGSTDLHGDLVICPPATLLATLAEIVADSPVQLGAQDCHHSASGAHTGDVSAVMLVDAGCRYVIVGHSERRTDHGESDEQVRAKAEAANAAGLRAIVCLGETEAQRARGETLAVVERQFRASLPAAATAGNTVIAYEPVWAIGTGKVPTPAEIAAVHAQLRTLACNQMTDGKRLRLLYGGSVKPGNAAEILAVANVNGALVGGASLSAGDFWAIARSCP
ncbi:MAG TPA: triose-phosphate isomerase [Candidatus Acidoferrum sp.]|nr:triose-phosphate isomerase [Candidatus Acidoferrum sp.]